MLGASAWETLPAAPLSDVHAMLRVGGKTVIVGPIEGDDAGARGAGLGRDEHTRRTHLG